MSAGPRIVELTGEDPEAIRTWAAVTEASLRHEVGDSATAWAFEELLAVVRNPSSKRDERFLAAYDGERLVGTAWLAMPLLDNLDSAMLDVHVDPALRRRRIGSALLARAESIAVDAGRTLVDAEAQFAHDAPADGAGTSGREFLVAHGYTFGIGNVQRSAPLPMPDDVLDALAAEAAPHHEGYRLRSWAGPVPDELVEGWLAVASTLSTEAPTGDMQREAETVDVAAHRDDEALVAAQGRTSWRTVALTAAGEVVAYTEIVVPDHDPRFVYQVGDARARRPPRPPSRRRGQGRQPPVPAGRRRRGRAARGDVERRGERPDDRDQRAHGLRPHGADGGDAEAARPLNHLVPPRASATVDGVTDRDGRTAPWLRTKRTRT